MGGKLTGKILDVQNVTVSFDKFVVLNKLNFSINHGELRFLIGPNGAGKTTLLDIITGKTFDNGVLCSSENSVVVDEAIAEDVRREFQAQGAYFMNPQEIEALAQAFVTSQRLPNPALVGLSINFQNAHLVIPTGEWAMSNAIEWWIGN